MKKYISTGYAWLDNSEVKTQLHIYTLDNIEEWYDITDVMTTQQAAQEFLSELGYVSDTIPVELLAGKTYTTYDIHLAGDFLIVEETVTIDV